MDSDSCYNYCSSRLVDKLTLTIIPHSKPYKLQWIKDDGGVVVKEPVNIPISIYIYQEKVLCDIVPM